MIAPKTKASNTGSRQGPQVGQAFPPVVDFDFMDSLPQIHAGGSQPVIAKLAPLREQG